MAVEVTSVWSESSLSLGVSAREVFNVSGVTSRRDALNANGPPYGAVPRYLNSHPEDTTLLASAPVATTMTPGVMYRVEVNYAPLGLTLGIAPPNPLNEPPKFSWASEEESEQIDIDLFGNPLITSNGDSIDPPAEITVTSRIIRVTRWLNQYDVGEADQFEWTTNDDPVSIPLCSGQIPEGCMLCRSIMPLGEYDHRATAILVQYLFAVRAFGWEWRFLDSGYRGWYKDTTTNKNKVGEFFTKEGTQCSRPVRLNGKGKPYDIDSIIMEKSAKTAIEIGKPAGATIVDTGFAIFLKYFRYDGNDFSGLGIF